MYQSLYTRYSGNGKTTNWIIQLVTKKNLIIQ